MIDVNITRIFAVGSVCIAIQSRELLHRGIEIVNANQ